MPTGVRSAHVNQNLQCVPTLLDVVRPQVVHKCSFGLSTKDEESGIVHTDCMPISTHRSRRNRHIRPLLRPCGDQASALRSDLTGEHDSLRSRMYNPSSWESSGLTFVSPPQTNMILSAMALACPTRGIGASPRVLTCIVEQSLTSMLHRSFLTFSCTNPPNMSMWPEWDGKAGTERPYRGKGDWGSVGGDDVGANSLIGRVDQGYEADPFWAVDVGRNPDCVPFGRATPLGGPS